MNSYMSRIYLHAAKEPARQYLKSSTITLLAAFAFAFVYFVTRASYEVYLPKITRYYYPPFESLAVTWAELSEADIHKPSALYLWIRMEKSENRCKYRGAVWFLHDDEGVKHQHTIDTGDSGRPSTKTKGVYSMRPWVVRNVRGKYTKHSGQIIHKCPEDTEQAITYVGPWDMPKNQVSLPPSSR